MTFLTDPPDNARSDLVALPTAVAPDGSPVAVYLALPAHDEAQLLHRAIAPGADVLELGCGAGRISQWLAEHDHRVVAVDQCLSMLRHVVRHPNIVPIQADIETLTLEWRFGGVVLPSYLVNTDDREQRARFLSTCRDHVTEDGVVLIQRVDPNKRWIVGAVSAFGSVRVRLLSAMRHGRSIRARLEYRIGEQTFEQAIATEILDDKAIGEALQQAELRLERWLDSSRTWLVARPL